MSTTASASSRPARPRMTRTKSSLLAFKLREFLDTRDEERAGHDPLPQPPAPPARRPSCCAYETEPIIAPVVPPSREAVWVDCYFYGFYIEADKAAQFQASLQQQQERLRGPSGLPQPVAA